MLAGSLFHFQFAFLPQGHDNRPLDSSASDSSKCRPRFQVAGGLSGQHFVTVADVKRALLNSIDLIYLWNMRTIYPRYQMHAQHIFSIIIIIIIIFYMLVIHFSS